MRKSYSNPLELIAVVCQGDAITDDQLLAAVSSFIQAGKAVRPLPEETDDPSTIFEKLRADSGWRSGSEPTRLNRED